MRAIGEAIDPNLTEMAQLEAVARAYRDFVLENPGVYGLAYTNTIPELRPDDDEQAEAVQPFEALLVPIAGAENSLAAVRGLWALIHGFVMLEIADQFQRGGDIAGAFDAAVHAYLLGWLSR